MRVTTSLLCLLLLLPAAAPARTFVPVGSANGLDARVVVSLLFDSRGYLWVGSREGLYRYDGYATRAYLPDPDNQHAISDIDIRYIYEDSEGVIWVGTNTGGLCRLDPNSETFTNYRHDSADPASIAEDSVYGISEGPDGSLWVATQKGLSRLDRVTGRFEHFVHDPDTSSSLPHNWAFNLYLAPSGTLWVSTIGGGVARWEGDAFTRFDLGGNDSESQQRNDAFTIHEANDGVLWIGTREGLVRLDPSTGAVQPFDLGEVDGYPPVITTIRPDSSNRIWLGTMVRGVLIVDTETGEWQPASEKSLGAAGYLPAQPQMSLAIANDQLFVGTWGSGVYRGPLEPTGFGLLSQADNESLNNNTITAVMAGEEPGHPWLGSFGGGPQRASVDPPWVSPVDAASGAIHESGVFAFARAGGGRLFVATTHGLYEFDSDGRQVALWAHDPEKPDGIGSGYAISLLPNDNSGLWIGMGGSGLQRLDLETNEFTTYRHRAEDDRSLSGDFITALARGSEGYLWAGTRSNGLNRCRIEPWSCERFTGREGDPDGLSHHHVTAFYRDRRDRLWVTTDGGGLNRVLQDESTGSVTGFRRWTREHGLLNDGIMAVQEDLDESLWLSTRHGLSRLNPATGNVINYVSDSGLPASHFHANASAADERFVYFGSVEGLLSIRKGSLLTEREAADVRITTIMHAAPGSLQSIARLVDGLVTLPYGNVISIELATLDFSESTHQYAYRLSTDDPWIDLGTQRQVILHGVAPGHYEVQARGRDVYGLWGESQPLGLEIVPPFWMTWWFRGMVVLVLAGIALLLFFNRERRLNRRAEELRRLSETREHALEEQLGGEAELAVLTPRQKEILQLIAEGYSTREIAELLGVSIKTVEAHRANLMERLDIRDIPGLVRLAIRTRLVSPHE
jgi:ligand-binding sensor domain-containing protein/DNA-binding CsgD family transcriptional regulator